MGNVGIRMTSHIRHVVQRAGCRTIRFYHASRPGHIVDITIIMVAERCFLSLLLTGSPFLPAETPFH